MERIGQVNDPSYVMYSSKVLPDFVSVCGRCSAIVVDTNAHTAFHDECDEVEVAIMDLRHDVRYLENNR